MGVAPDEGGSILEITRADGSCQTVEIKPVASPIRRVRLTFPPNRHIKEGERPRRTYPPVPDRRENPGREIADGPEPRTVLIGLVLALSLVLVWVILMFVGR